MESSELALYRGLGAVRNYGILVLVGLFVLSGIALATLNWIETNELQSELIMLSQNLPAPDSTKVEQTINLPDDVIALHVTTAERTGFYETTIVNKDFLAYAAPDKHYVLMKSEATIEREIKNFALALLALYIGNVVLLLGWWFFIRTKVRELFEVV